MFEVSKLQVVTPEGEALAYRHYRVKGEPAGLVVLFPGVHYGADGPLLYFPAQTLREAGWDTLQLTYRFQRDVLGFELETMPGVAEDCHVAVRSALENRIYPRLLLLGKSLGAGLAAFLCQDREAFSPARVVYFTPPIATPIFDPAFARTRQPSHIVLGTLDRFYDEERLDRWRQAPPFSLTLVDGADHAMTIPGDMDASIRVLRRTSQETVAFCLEED